MLFSRSSSPMPKRMRVVAFVLALCAGSFLRTASACTDRIGPAAAGDLSAATASTTEIRLSFDLGLIIAYRIDFDPSGESPGTSALSKSGPQVSLSGPLTSDSVASVAVSTGSGGGPGQPFSAIIKVNGWVTSHMGFVWNEATQSWGTQWLIPPGSKGATVTVTITASDGSTTTTSFVVQ